MELGSARTVLTQEVAALLQHGGSAEDVVDLVVRSGWEVPMQKRTDSEYVEGVLDSGKRVTVEIRRARLRSAA